jgi:hypothetical protein
MGCFHSKSSPDIPAYTLSDIPAYDYSGITAYDYSDGLQMVSWSHLRIADWFSISNALC